MLTLLRYYVQTVLLAMMMFAGLFVAGTVLHVFSLELPGLFLWIFGSMLMFIAMLMLPVVVIVSVFALVELAIRGMRWVMATLQLDRRKSHDEDAFVVVADRPLVFRREEAMTPPLVLLDRDTAPDDDLLDDEPASLSDLLRSG